MSNWVELVARGSRASQPTAASVGAGPLYCVTDEGNIIEQSNGSAWVAYSPTAASGVVSDTAYDATSWDGVTAVAPSKNAVRDKIESMGSGLVSDTAYGSGWNGDTTTAPSKNAVYDKIETLGGGGSGNPYNLTVAPVFGSFAWVNQGGATGAVTANNVMVMNAPVSGNVARILKQASPGAAMTVTAAFNTAMIITASSGWSAGLCLYDSGSGEVLLFIVNGATGGTPRFTLSISEWADVSTPTVNDLGPVEFNWFAPLIWLRIQDDGATNRSFSYSVDGESWMVILTHARTTLFTSPDSAGYVLNAASGSIDAQLYSPSFELTSP